MMYALMKCMLLLHLTTHVVCVVYCCTLLPVSVLLIYIECTAYTVTS